VKIFHKLYLSYVETAGQPGLLLDFDAPAEYTMNDSNASYSRKVHHVLWSDRPWDHSRLPMFEAGIGVRIGWTEVKSPLVATERGEARGKQPLALR